MEVYLHAAVAIVLLSCGCIALLPTVRARWHHLRGNYAAAAEIYERLLARHPERLQLYPALAEIYLLLPRADEHALQVFRKVVRYNLESPNREAIDEILMQKRLAEGGVQAKAGMASMKTAE
ncbi:hypothetical protein HUU40_16640 [candidate division KSB1 bacterium]|nr:hypothetical protein [candidate division KSB1 bacterium]